MAEVTFNVKDERVQLKALEDLFKQKRFSDALNLARRFKEDFPRSFQIRFLHVRILKELNRLGEAEDALRDLMLVFPNNLNLLQEIGKLCIERNKYNEATEHYNKILFLDPFNSAAKSTLDKIKLLKKSEKRDTGFISYSSEKIHRADTLPEFDTQELKRNVTPPPTEPVMKTVTPTPPPKTQPPSQANTTPPPPPVSKPVTDIFSAPPKATSTEQLKSIAREDTQKEYFPETLDDFSFMEEDTSPHFTLNEPESVAHPAFQVPPEEEEKPVVSEEKIPEPNPEILFQPSFESIQESTAEPGITEPQNEFLDEFEPPSFFESEAQAEPILEQETIQYTDEVEEPSPTFDFIREEEIPDNTQFLREQLESFEGEAEPEPEEIEPETDSSALFAENPEFQTESAAELYMKQGLYDDALTIYQQLYNSNKNEKFASRIAFLKNQKINRAKIQFLDRFLVTIREKYKGDQLV